MIRKKADNIVKWSPKPAPLAAAKPGRRNSPSGSIGAAERRSCSTNVPSSAAPIAYAISVEAEAQLVQQAGFEANEDGGPDVRDGEGAEQGLEGQEGAGMRFAFGQRALGHGGGGGQVMAARVDALARLAIVRAELGSFAIELLEVVFVDDRTWSSLGHGLGIDPRTARAWTIAALRALATVNLKSRRGE